MMFELMLASWIDAGGNIGSYTINLWWETFSGEGGDANIEEASESIYELFKI